VRWLGEGQFVRVRRVVTGQQPDGKSVFASDTFVEPIQLAIMPTTEFHRIWGSDSPPSLPTDGGEPAAPLYFPPESGYRFAFFTLGPDSVTLPEDLDIGQALEELGTKLPGLGEAMEPENPGMHTTDTVDIDVVISGEVDLELDDGETVHLRAGDCVIQNGTRHAWRNKSSEPVVIFVTLLGARRQAG
jgi:mannose-6-phosphate isomerase-like protein (cupin superfamily)